MKLPAAQVYDGLIADMRRDGYTLRAIGEKIGVTGERVRQILWEFYPEAKSLPVSEGQLAKSIGCSRVYLTKRRELGMFHPLKVSGSLILYSRDECEKAMLACLKKCPHCGEVHNRFSLKYCFTCAAERIRSGWSFRSERGRQVQSAATERWRRAHPERAKKIMAAAQRRYHARKRAEELKLISYLVFRKGGAFPVGTVFKAVDCVNHQLILHDGSKVDAICVKKVMV